MGNNMSDFKEGDEVIINIKDTEVIQQMQANHGGWNDKMKECMTGPSTLVQGLGTDVLIKGPSGGVYRVNPEILSKYISNGVNVGAKVMITDKEEEMKLLQLGHGGWSDGMKELLGKTVEVVQRFPDGDIKVKYDNRMWTVNPACVSTTSGLLAKKVVVGQKVKLLRSKELVMKYQENHGGWSELMTLMLGQEVEVVEVLGDGDYFVTLYGMKWMVNGLCFENEEENETKKKVKLRKGDIVKVCDNLDRCKELQQYHGGWVSAMKMLLGKMGKVDAVLPTGDVKVTINGMSFVYNSALLTKMENVEIDKSGSGSGKFKIGDKVKVLKDKSKVMRLQKDHGEWVDSMKMILGEKGKVKSIFPDGDLRVKIMGNLITLNPECVKKIADESDSDSDVPDMLKMMKQVAKMMGQVDSDDSDKEENEDKEKEEILSPPMKMQHMKLFAAVKTGDLEQTKEGVKMIGANIAQMKITPLMVAVSEGHNHITEYLLSNGANIGAKDSDGDTALHLAVQRNRADTCKILLDHGANVNTSNDTMITPVMLAAVTGVMEILKMLVAARGVDLNVGDKDKDTALHLAIQKSRLDSVEILLDAGANISLLNEKSFSPFHLAVLRGHEKILEAFLKRSGSSIVDQQKEDKFAAIHLAAINNHPRCLEVLIKYKADVNIRNNKMQTALHLAVSQKYLECVKILVANKAEMNLKDDSGDTPLHDGVRGHNMEKIKRMGALFGMPDMFQMLQGVSKGSDSCEDIVLYLARAGAKLDIKNNSGQTPISACEDEELKKKLMRIKDGTAGTEPTKETKRPGVSKSESEVVSPPPSTETNASSEMETLRQKIRKLEDENICIICYDNKKDCTFNCGHVSCYTCALNLYECHICRVPIETRVRMFL